MDVLSDEERAEIHKAWDEALISGKYDKGKDALCAVTNNGPQFCCLGVLAEVINDQFPEVYQRLDISFVHHLELEFGYDDDDRFGNVIEHEEGIVFDRVETTFLPDTLAAALGFAGEGGFGLALAHPETFNDDQDTVQLVLSNVNDKNDTFEPVIEKIKELREKGFLPKSA